MLAQVFLLAQVSLAQLPRLRPVSSNSTLRGCLFIYVAQKLSLGFSAERSLLILLLHVCLQGEKNQLRILSKTWKKSRPARGGDGVMTTPGSFWPWHSVAAKGQLCSSLSPPTGSEEECVWQFPLWTVELRGGLQGSKGEIFPSYNTGLVKFLCFVLLAFSPPASTASKEPHGFGYPINQAGNGLSGRGWRASEHLFSVRPQGNK